MTTSIIREIDLQIARLQKAKSYLEDSNERRPVGRPTTTGQKAKTEPVALKGAKRTMSAEGKARIAAAQKARWAKARKSAK